MVEPPRNRRQVAPARRAPPLADGDSEKVATIKHLNEWLDTQGPAYHAGCKRTFAEEAARVLRVETPPVADPTPEALAAWALERAAVVADFKRARRAYDEGQKRAGLPHLSMATANALDILDTVEAKVFAMIPSTAPGAIALLQYYAETVKHYDPNSEFLPVLKNALPALKRDAVA